MREEDYRKLEDFVCNLPIFEYRLVNPSDWQVAERVRIICREECPRYGLTWACPPGCGKLSECEKRIHSYQEALLFSSVAEVSDLMDMEEMLDTRNGHEQITDSVRDFIESEGYETFTLSTESCSICGKCTYLDGLPCRFPRQMHPCIESYGLVVSQLAEEEGMEYNLGGNTILWFSIILMRPSL